MEEDSASDNEWEGMEDDDSEWEDVEDSEFEDSEPDSENMEVQETNSALEPVDASAMPGTQQSISELASLDIKTVEQLKGGAGKTDAASAGSTESGPGRDRSDITDEQDVRLKTLLSELNRPAVMDYKAHLFNLNCQVGDLYRTELGDFQSALQYYQNMLECAQALSENMKEAEAHNRLGLTYDMLGKHKEAVGNHERALAICKGMADRETDVCVAYKNLASSQILSGQISDAKANYESALAAGKGTENKTEQMETYCLLGDLVREKLDEPQVSHKHYTNMLALVKGLGKTYMAGEAYNRLGLACQGMQDYKAALKWHKRFLQMKRNDGDTKQLIIAHINVADAYRLMGKVDKATSNYNTALQMANETRDQHGEMEVLFMIGEMHREQLQSPDTSVQYYEQALSLAKQLGDKTKEGVVYNRLGHVHEEMEGYEAALEWFKKELKTAQDAEDKEHQATVHGRLGETYGALGKVDEATSHYNIALKLLQRIGDQREQMNVYLSMGEMHRERPKSSRTSIQYYEQYLTVAKQLVDRQSEMMACSRLGTVYFEIGENEDALKWLQKALKLAQDYADEGEQISALKNVAAVSKELGRPDKATFHFTTALQLTGQTGDMETEMELCSSFGELYMKQLNAPRDAIQYYNQHLELAKQLKDRDGMADASNMLGQAYYKMKEHEAALKWYTKFLKIAKDDEDKEVEIVAHTNVGDACRVLGKVDQATVHLNRALQMAQQTGYHLGQMKANYALGEMHREQLHSPQISIKYYEHYLALARQLMDKDEERLAYNRLGLVHSETGMYKAALKWFKKYLQMVKDGEDKKEQATAYKCLGDTYRSLGKLTEATSHFTTALEMAQQTGDQQTLMDVNFKMAELQREKLYCPHESIRYYKQHLALARELMDRCEEGLAYNRMGRAYLELGDVDTALEWHQKSLKMAEDSGDRNEKITANKNIAECYKTQGKVDMAKSHYKAAMDVAMETDHKEEQDEIAKALASLKSRENTPH